MKQLRYCSRPGCSNKSVATLTYSYQDCKVVIGELISSGEPNSWDLCAEHANKVTVPKGWQLIKNTDDFHSFAEDDLIALAVAVSEKNSLTNQNTVEQVDKITRQILLSSSTSSKVQDDSQINKRRGHLRIIK